jgi:hypothetical protein
VPEETKSSSSLFLIERREAQRILVNVPVEIIEIDGDGHSVSERTIIEDVSDFGCRFSACGPVKQGDTVAVKILGRYGHNLPDESPRLYEIMWIAPKEHGATVGARVLEGEKLANTKFPLAYANQERDRR